MFELGIDYHRRGSEQLREAEACLQLVYEKARKGKEVKVVISEHTDYHFQIGTLTNTTFG